MNESDQDRIADEYFARFGLPLPCPACINHAYVAEVAARYMANGKPIPKFYNWWAHLPDGAVS